MVPIVPTVEKGSRGSIRPARTARKPTVRTTGRPADWPPGAVPPIRRSNWSNSEGSIWPLWRHRSDCRTAELKEPGVLCGVRLMVANSLRSAKERRAARYGARELAEPVGRSRFWRLSFSRQCLELKRRAVSPASRCRYWMSKSRLVRILEDSCYRGSLPKNLV